jgi:hypothetical protein
MSRQNFMDHNASQQDRFDEYAEERQIRVFPRRRFCWRGEFPCHIKISE